MICYDETGASCPLFITIPHSARLGVFSSYFQCLEKNEIKYKHFTVTADMSIDEKTFQ